MENENEAAEETIIILFICTLKRVAAECSFLVFVGMKWCLVLLWSTRQKWHIPNGEWHDRDIVISMEMTLVHMPLAHCCLCCASFNQKMIKCARACKYNIMWEYNPHLRSFFPSLMSNPMETTLSTFFVCLHISSSIFKLVAVKHAPNHTKRKFLRNARKEHKRNMMQ